MKKPRRVNICTKGPKQGQCNICGNVGPLTEDHTPPKGVIRATATEIRHVLALLAPSAKEEGQSMVISQSGVKFRTLCARCNNALLGAKYDPALIKLSNDVGALLKTALALPSVVNVNVHPQALMRSVLGHAAAQGVDRYRKGPLTEALRDYMLDKSLPLPNGIRIFCWPYSYSTRVLVRDAGFVDLGPHPPFTFWLLKFFPMAFMITWDEVHRVFPAPIQDLEPWRYLPFGQAASLSVVLSSTVSELWPLAPSDIHVPVFGQEALLANAR